MVVSTHGQAQVSLIRFSINAIMAPTPIVQKNIFWSISEVCNYPSG